MESSVAPCSEESVCHRLAYSQSGRLLIACDNIAFATEIAVPHRINLWDMADGSLAHQLKTPAGLPPTIEVSPNGRHLVVMLKDSYGVTCWRLPAVNGVTDLQSRCVLATKVQYIVDSDSSG